MPSVTLCCVTLPALSYCAVVVRFLSAVMDWVATFTRSSPSYETVLVRWRPSGGSRMLVVVRPRASTVNVCVVAPPPVICLVRFPAGS